jgi:hypothetical protein
MLQPCSQLRIIHFLKVHLASKLISALWKLRPEDQEFEALPQKKKKKSLTNT